MVNLYDHLARARYADHRRWGAAAGRWCAGGSGVDARTRRAGPATVRGRM